MITDLRQYINLLSKEGQLQVVDASVDPHLEAAEIHRRVIAEEGPALLFTNIKGASFPLITNMFGTSRRVALAFGPRPEQLVKDIARLPEELMPPSISTLWKNKNVLIDLARIGFKRSSNGAATQIQEESPGLNRLPLLTTWQEDGGPFVTLPLVYTEHPDTGIHNLGMYRLQRFDDTTTGFHCQIGKGAGFHLAAAGDLGQKLPVNVSIGGPPGLILSAIAPLPENVPELLLAALMLGKKLPLCKNPFGPLPVIATSEFVLVGEVNPEELKPEGPFGDHYGYYSLKHDYPVLRCRGLLRKKDPICTATVVGKPRQEDFFLGEYLQKLLAPVFPLVMPAVTDLWSYGDTGFHSLTAAVVKQRYKREAMASAFRILGEGQLSLTKFLLVLDSPQDLQDIKAVLTHILERADFRTDLYVFSNLAMDTLDYTGPVVNEGSKGVLLGCGDPIRSLPTELRCELPLVIKQAVPFCPGCLVVDGPSFSKEPDFAATLSTFDELSKWPLIVLVDNAVETCRSEASFLWTTFTRFEPGADLIPAAKVINRNHISYTIPIVIDARMKPTYPAELDCDPDTAALVSRRWREYFPG